jgi:hypothetical protein
MANKADDTDSQITTDTLILAYLCTKEAKTLRDKLRILDRFHLPDDKVAQICECSTKDVTSARYHMKREAASREKGSHKAKRSSENNR